MRLRFALLRLARLPFAAAALAVLTAAAACDGQGEGQRCDMRAANLGTSDCQSGLTCTNVMYNGSIDVCCPADRALSTTPACSNNVAIIVPPDASGDDGAIGDDGASSVDGPTE